MSICSASLSCEREAGFFDKEGREEKRMKKKELLVRAAAQRPPAGRAHFESVSHATLSKTEACASALPREPEFR